jgi:uncharacterized membrane protein YhiD involved in acid resistance
MDILFNSISTTGTFNGAGFLVCLVTSLILGVAIAALHMTLIMLPAIVQVVIMMVNGNLGTGVAVMGAFSLVRFRSAPGSAREIGSIFLSMAVGLATGMGYIGVAVLFVVIMGIVNVAFCMSSFGEKPHLARELRITIPESLDYTEVFDDIFRQYTKSCRLVSSRTSNMGSMFKLSYSIELKAADQEKKMIDELRCRNGNLEIMCSQVTAATKEEL